MNVVTFIPHHFGIRAVLQLHMMYTHKIQTRVHPPKCEFEFMPFSNQECRDNFSIYLMNHIVDGQISTTRLANSRNTPFDKQWCMATDHWTSDQKGYNTKNKVIQFQKLDIINKMHIISKTLCTKPIKISQMCQH